jgi:hypothetical protein
MSWHVCRVKRALIVAVAVGLLGCGEGMPKAVALGDDAHKKSEVDEEALARRRAEREAQQRAKQEAEEHLRSELIRLCVVPDGGEPPSCEEVSQAYDAFVRRVSDNETIADWDGGKKDEALAMAIVQCTQSGSGKVAACQKHAFDNAGKEIAAHAEDLLDTCIDRFGKAGGDPGAVPAKPAG